MERDELERQIRALDEGRGSIGLDGFRAVQVSGRDAAAWLQDLVTADVGSLEPDGAVRSLLLGPTGRIRADLHVLLTGDAFLLLQSLDQPVSIATLLAPYVLSSDVGLADVPPPDLAAVPRPGSWVFAPVDAAGLEPVEPEALEAWRIRRGIARYPVDLNEDSLPAEAGLDDEVTIDRTKGCYLGQEAVAKVRNLGHPNRTIQALTAERQVEAGAPVFAEGLEAGVLTSVDGSAEATSALARVRWDAREADLLTADGTPLRRP